jgi:branched-chain amino acid transport system substrate-binding protein
MSRIARTSSITRRTFVKAGAASAAATALAGRFAAPAIAQTRAVKVGYVSPQTGPLAPFAAADNFVLSSVREKVRSGVQIGGRTQTIEFIPKDSQSNPNRAAEVANDLILKDKVDLMLVASTPETTNPVGDQCELNEVPCVSTKAPWQPWYFGRGGAPDKPFKYTWHYFWGLEDVIAVFTNMWSQLDTNKIVGGLFPNDADGNAWGDPNVGFPKPLAAKGFKLFDPGRFQSLTDNFSAQISAFKRENVQIITGVIIPPDLGTFWNQALQQGFKPKAASIGKAILFPSSVEALGNVGHNLSSEVWWSPSHPFTSSLTGQSAQQLADAFEQATRQQWTQPVGFIHSLFEVAVDVVKRSQGAGQRDAMLDAIVKTDLNTVVGKVKWGAGPVKNVCKTPLVAGQWRLGGKHKYQLVIVDNQTAPNIPVGGKMEPIA